MTTHTTRQLAWLALAVYWAAGLALMPITAGVALMALTCHKAHWP